MRQLGGSNEGIFSQQSLKKIVLGLILTMAVVLTLFFVQGYHHDKVRALQKKYGTIQREYIESFQNQINYHEERLGLLEKSRNESKEVIDGIRDITAGQETTFQIMKTRAGIIESLILAYKLP